ncbi:MAG: hypothetical protein HUU37_08615, partial [Bdellovibrionales bacterium]|nr:hypothetical protein [Bdellovibrionales bacterium]
MRRFELIVLLLLAGCSSSSENEKAAEAQDATFVVEEVTGAADASGADAHFSSVATSRIVNFTACLKDVAVLERIQNRVFEVLDGTSSVVARRTTDPSGCLQWSEQIPFNALAEEAFIENTRAIRAVQDHKGTVTVNVAVNPWIKGSGAVKDLRYRTPPKVKTSAQQAAAPDGESTLHLAGLRAELAVTKAQADGVDGVLRLQFTPKFRRKGLDGSTVMETLSEGKFRIRHQVIAQDGAESLALYGAGDVEISFHNDLAQAYVPVKITHRPNKESLLRLQVEVTPVQAPQGLTPVSGVVQMGRFNSLIVGSSTEFTERAWEETILQDQPQRDAVEFVVGQVRSTRTEVALLGSTGRPKLIHVGLRACLRNAISEQSIVNRKFRVESLGKTRAERVSDGETGCIEWEEPVSFDYFAKERAFERKFIITSLDGFYQGRSAEVSVHLNPWLHESAAGVAVDARYGDGAVAPGSTGGSEMFINGAAFNSAGRDFDLDTLLNLTVIRKLRFEVRPVIRRMTSSGWRTENLGNGRYMLHVLVQSMDDGSTLAAISQPVEAGADAVNTELELRFDDLRPTLQRNRLFVELAPVDRNPGLVSLAFEGMFEATQPGGWIRLQKAGKSVAGLVKSHEAKPAARDADSWSLYAKLLRKNFPRTLVASSSNHASLGLTGQSMADGLVQNPRNTLLSGRLCPYFFPEKRAANLCRNAPEEHLSFMPSWHTTQLHRKEQKYSDLMGFAVSAGFGFTSGESKDKSTGSSWSGGVRANGGGGAKVGPVELGIGVSGGKEWFTSESHSVREWGKDNKADTSMDKKLDVEEIGFTIDADARRCLTVQPKALEKRPEQTRTLLLCSSQPERRTFEETYF